MPNDQALRQQLNALLNGGQAYMPFDQAINQFPMDHINAHPPNVPYTFWHLLEHMRITQKDILDYIEGGSYVPRAWPSGYWPAATVTGDAAAWQTTVDQFRHDLGVLKTIVLDPDTDLTAPLRHAPQHNILREILIVTDHNAYHTGELAILRQVMGLWPTGHVV